MTAMKRSYDSNSEGSIGEEPVRNAIKKMKIGSQSVSEIARHIDSNLLPTNHNPSRSHCHSQNNSRSSLDGCNIHSSDNNTSNSGNWKENRSPVNRSKRSYFSSISQRGSFEDSAEDLQLDSGKHDNTYHVINPVIRYKRQRSDTTNSSEHNKETDDHQNIIQNNNSQTNFSRQIENNLTLSKEEAELANMNKLLGDLHNLRLARLSQKSMSKNSTPSKPLMNSKTSGSSIADNSCGSLNFSNGSDFALQGNDMSGTDNSNTESATVVSDITVSTSMKNRYSKSSNMNGKFKREDALFAR